MNDNPGPGAYHLGTTIGKAVAKSISSRQPEISSKMVIYNLDRQQLS